MLPDFLVIGGMKCGTSALQHYLSGQEKISMAQKNIDFFNDELWHKGKDWYLSQLPEKADGDTLIGEISTEYTKFPDRRNAPERIAQVMPDVKLIYVVRHPIRRMISHYIHCVSNLTEKRSPSMALGATGHNPYLSYSLYYRQVSQYLSYFRKEQIKLIRSEDLLSKPEATLRDMLGFLNADLNIQVEPAMIHTRKEKRAWNAIGAYIRKSPSRFNLFNYYLKRLPKPLSDLLLWSTGRPVEVAPVPHDLYTSIIDRLRPDLEDFYDFAGDRFTRWNLDRR